MSKKITFFVVAVLIFGTAIILVPKNITQATTPGMPDLQIKDLSYQQSENTINGIDYISINFKITYKNNSSVTVNDSFYLTVKSKPTDEYPINGFMASSLITKEIKPGVLFTDTISGSYLINKTNFNEDKKIELTAGVDKVYYDPNDPTWINQDNKINESNENNNELVKTFIIEKDEEKIKISNISVDVFSNSAKINWITNKKDVSYIVYGTENTSNGINMVVKDSVLKTKHSLTIPGLLSNTKYYYQIYSATLTSNLIESEVKSFTTISSDMIIKNIKATGVNENFTIKWQTNGYYDCTMIYSLKDGNLDDDYLHPGRDPEDYIWGSIFPKSNINEIYYYSINVVKHGDSSKSLKGDKMWYMFICYDNERSRKKSDVYSFRFVDDLPGIACTMEYLPVCGVDGITYSNRCVAEQQNKVKVAYEGECRSGDENTNRLIIKLQRKIGELERQVIDLEKKLTQLDEKFSERYAGTMFLDVENHGRLWYVDPSSKNRFYFENGKSALSIGSKLALGITYEDIQKIPVGIPDKLYNLEDSDGDGLPDRLEIALGSDPNKADSNGDGYSDKEKLLSGYYPVTNQKYNYDEKLTKRLEGKMLLQVAGPHSHGEIWYVHEGKRWYGGTEDSMYEIMKARSLGAKPEDIRKIEVGEVRSAE